MLTWNFTFENMTDMTTYLDETSDWTLRVDFTIQEEDDSIAFAKAKEDLRKMSYGPLENARWELIVQSCDCEDDD